MDFLTALKSPGCEAGWMVVSMMPALKVDSIGCLKEFMDQRAQNTTKVEVNNLEMLNQKNRKVRLGRGLQKSKEGMYESIK